MNVLAIVASTNTGVKRVPEGKWLAYINVQGQRRYLGTFEDEAAAARAVDAEAQRVWLNPTLNFLPDGSLNPDRKKGISK